VSDTTRRTPFFKRSLPNIAAVIFFLSIVFCPFTDLRAAEERSPHDAYVSSGIGDARILIPFLADDTSSGSICALVYNGLTKVDKDLNIVGDLSESWEITDEGLTITFILKKNVLWHDGVPFTAEDVKFTFDTILDPANGCPYISGYSDIREIEVIDPYTVKFRYARPYAPALLKLGMGIIPRHLFEGVRDIRKSPYARFPVGTGPYMFSKWESGHFIILEANKGYFEHAPGIERYVYKIIPDQSVQFLELVAGDVDSMDLNPYQFFYRSETRQFREKIEKYEYLAHSYTYIGYNLKDPLFSDKRVRRALSYAINKREIIDAVLLGLGEPCTGPFLKTTPYYDDEAPGYDYDPAKAAKLLRDAGWKDTDGDGVLDRGGMEFRVKLATNQGSQVREDVATVVQSQWAALGIRTDIQVVAWSAFLDQFVNKKNFQAVILGWTIPVDPDIYAVWHTSSAKPGGLNFVSYSNERVDELIEAGRREFSPEERREIYREAHRLIAEDAPYTFLFFPYATPAVNKRFKGIEPAPAGIGYNFIDWYVPEREVKYKF
jgi:peptide/nickel transport system substrate-binding protein